MAYVLRLVGPGGVDVLSDNPPTGSMVSAFDALAYDGLGRAVWTLDLAEALVFADPLEALAFWQQVPAELPDHRVLTVEIGEVQ